MYKKAQLIICGETIIIKRGNNIREYQSPKRETEINIIKLHIYSGKR